MFPRAGPVPQCANALVRWGSGTDISKLFFIAQKRKNPGFLMRKNRVKFETESKIGNVYLGLAVIKNLQTYLFLPN
jgi:hypothetical protein